MSYAGSLLFGAAIYFGFNFYNFVVVPAVGSTVTRRLPDKVKPLEKLSTKDKVCIALAKLVTILFVYHCIQFVTSEYSGMVCNLDIGDILRSVAWWPVHLPLLFIIYDLPYTLFHWFLHWKPIYPLVHKHHHRQMSPFRGNEDAINTHPLEYIPGEYLHLFSIWALTRIFGPGIHAVTLLMFVFIGGTLASLNHTRFDIRLPYVFNVWAHDFHHRQPQCNFGQYIMLWDLVFGTYRPVSD